MTNGDPDQWLMQHAWARLWKPGTPYYLPTAIVSGASGNGVTVDALGGLHIADTGAIPLVKSSTWGNISVDLTNVTLMGLGSMTNGGMTYDDSTGAFTATVGIPNAEFTGDYDVEGSGIAGCAVDAAGIALKPFQQSRADMADGDDDPNLDLARAYRDQLVLSSDGLDHVATYYDHNDTYNEVVSAQDGPNSFTKAWPVYQTNGKTSKDFASQTSSAAQNPTDPSDTVGDTDYNLHSFVMQGILMKTLFGMSKSSGDKYELAAQASLDFKTEVMQQPAAPTTVGAVMTKMGTTPPGADSVPPEQAPTDDAGPSMRELAERADAIVEEVYPRFEAEAQEERARIAMGGPADSSTGVQGTFTDVFSVPTATLSGTIEVVGTPPNTSLQATLTGLDATIPSIAVQLAGSGGLLEEAQNAIANAHWFQQLLTKKVHDRLNESDILTWLTDRVNQSITQALGDFG